MKYNNVEINQDEFLQQVAKDSISYLQEQGWTNKTNEAWKKSLAEIINGEIESSSVASEGQYAGQRVIHTNKNFNIESLSKKQKRIYSDVAWFLDQEMEKFANNKQEKQEEQKIDLPKFTNDQFSIDFNKIIANDRYGGQKFTEDQWNSIDERDSTGKRDTSKRSQLLANYLRQYSDQITGKYDYTDSPFKNEQDLKERINTAIKSLEDGVWDQNDIDNLNRIGINPEIYLSNGLKDIKGTIEGNPITYEEYNSLVEQQAKAEEENKKKEQERLEKSKETLRFTNLEEYKSPTFAKDLSFIENAAFRTIAEKYPDEESLINDLNTIAKKQGNLDYKDQAIVQSAFRIFSKNNILEDLDDNDRDLLSKVSDNVDGLKKIKGVTGIYYDPTTKKFFRGSHGEFKNDVLSQYRKPITPPSNKLKDNWTWSSSDIVEAGALVGDIASLVYPGAVGGAFLGTGAALARTYASIDKGTFNFWDRLLDIGTGVIGGIPVLGDALMVGKIGKGVKFFLQSAGVLEAMSNSPEFASVAKKLSKGDYSDITVDEWKGLLTFFRGITGAGRVFKSNRSIAEAARRSGLEVKNGFWKQALGTGPEITRTNLHNFKAKVGEKEINVELKNEEYDNLIKNLRKVRPGKKSQEKSQEIIKKAIEPKIKEIKPDVKTEDITITYSPTWRRFIPYTGTKNVASNLGVTDSEIAGNTIEEFKNSLQNRSTWDKIINGSNRALMDYRKRLIKDKSGQINPVTTAGSQNTRQLLSQGENSIPEIYRSNPETAKRYGDIIINKNFSNTPLVLGNDKLGKDALSVVQLPNGSYSLLHKGNVIENSYNQKHIQQAVANIIQQNVKNVTIEEMGKILRDYKSKGWLKYGGKIKN